MGLYVNPRSPFWWMLLEGHGRKRESTGIRRDGSSAALRKQQRADAEAIYHGRMTQLARSRVGLPIDTSVTFDTFATWYAKHHTAKHRGYDRESRILTLLRAFFGPLTLREIRPGKWKEYETHRLEAGVINNTVGRELAVMKAILAAAVGEHVEVSPLAHVKRQTTKLPAKRTLTAADETQLLEELPTDEIRDLYLVGVGTLLRQTNLIHLQRREHHDSRLVVQTKTGPHQVPLTGPTVLQTRAAMVLRRRMPKTLDGYFFPTWHQHFTKDRDSGNAWFLKVVKRAVARAGLPWGLVNHGVVWHTMTRASGATRMLREHGVDVRTVQLVGGWRSLDQMAEYLGVDMAFSAGAVKATTSDKPKGRYPSRRHAV